ncbi:MAG: MFS transporter [Lachnospiraceae bacterium]|nr:MFS transporter [Lachnospiraceae bacterium]
MNGKKRSLVLVILSLIAGMVYLTPLLRFSFYDQMLEALQITDVQLGTIGSIYGIFNVACYVPSGILAEKFNTKKLLMVSTLGMCLTTVWYSLYPGFTALLVIHALYGIFSVGTFWSPYLKAVRQLGSEEEQGRIFGLSEGLRGIGQTIAAFVCLGAMGLFATQAAGFRALLWINVGIFALLLAAVIFLVPDFDRQSDKTDAPETDSLEKSSKKEKPSILQTLFSSSTWICIFVILCGYTIWNTANGYIGTYCTRVLNLPAGLSSTLSIIRSYIIVFVAGLSGGFIIDKFKTKGLGMLTAFLLSGVSAAGIFLTGNLTLVPLCIGITIVLSYLANVIKATYWSIMGDAGIPVASTGMATGVISLIALTPDIFVSPVISRFIRYGENLGQIETGFNMMLIWIVVWAVLGIVASLILKRRKEKNSALS